jgi:hypothetical protein
MSKKIEDEEEHKPHFDVDLLNDSASKYTPEQKIEAVSLYVLYGNMKKVSLATGLPWALIRGWKTKTKWWDGVYQEIVRAKNDELQGVMTQILDKAMTEIQDRIENGNEVVNKEGEKHRVKVPAKELALVAGIMFDKRQMLRGEPSSIRQSNQVNVSDLKAQFEEFAKELKNEKVVSSQ